MELVAGISILTMIPRFTTLTGFATLFQFLIPGESKNTKILKQ